MEDGLYTTQYLPLYISLSFDIKERIALRFFTGKLMVCISTKNYIEEIEIGRKEIQSERKV